MTKCFQYFDFFLHNIPAIAQFKNSFLLSFSFSSSNKVLISISSPLKYRLLTSIFILLFNNSFNYDFHVVISALLVLVFRLSLLFLTFFSFPFPFFLGLAVDDASNLSLSNFASNFSAAFLYQFSLYISFLLAASVSAILFVNEVRSLSLATTWRSIL